MLEEIVYEIENKIEEDKNYIYIPKNQEKNIFIEIDDDAINNIVVISDSVRLHQSHIKIKGSNNLIYIKNNEKSGRLNIDLEVYENTSFYLGENALLKDESPLSIQVAKNTNVFIGDNSVISGNVKISTKAEKKDTNRSIIIGDHVLISEGLTIFKGSMIGSGAKLLETSTFAGTKEYISNTIYGKTPAESEQIENKEKIAEVKHKEDKNTISPYDFDYKLINAAPIDKLRLIENLSKSENRFAITKEKEERKKYTTLIDKLTKERIEVKQCETQNENTIKIKNLYWDNSYLHIILDRDCEELTLYRKKTKEYVSMIKVEVAHFKINVVNVYTDNRVLYGSYQLVSENKKFVIETELYNHIKEKERIFLFPKENAYLAFFKIRKGTIKFHFQTYKNTDLTKVIKEPRPKTKKQFAVRIMKFGTELIYKTTRFFTPKKKKDNTVIFLTMNKDVIDGNLEAVYEYMSQHTDYKLVKEAFNIFKTPNIKKIRHVYREVKKIARSNYIFIDNYTPIFNYLDLPEEVELIQLWHAGVGFKSVGYSRFGKDGSPNILRSSHRKYTRAIASTKKAVDIYQDVFGITEDKFIITGLPRIDKLEESQDEVRKKVLKQYPELKNTKNVLFAPTYRGKGQSVAKYNMQWLNLDAIDEFCREHKMKFIIKMHPFVNELEVNFEKYKNIINLSDYPDMNELLCISDAMITDFSSNVYEAALLEVPIIFFAPDKEEYEINRGVHRTLDEFAGDDIARNTEQLLEKLSDLKIKDWQVKFREEEVQLKHSGSSKKIVETIFGKDAIVR